MRFTDDEWMLMMLYSPGTRTGLIAELQKMQKSLTGRDRNLRRWTASLLAKLAEIRGRSMEAEKESATVQPEPAAPVQPDYRVGDTLYLESTGLRATQQAILNGKQ